MDGSFIKIIKNAEEDLYNDNNIQLFHKNYPQDTDKMMKGRSVCSNGYESSVESDGDETGASLLSSFTDAVCEDSKHSYFVNSQDNDTNKNYVDFNDKNLNYKQRINLGQSNHFGNEELFIQNQNDEYTDISMHQLQQSLKHEEQHEYQQQIESLKEELMRRKHLIHQQRKEHEDCCHPKIVKRYMMALNRNKMLTKQVEELTEELKNVLQQQSNQQPQQMLLEATPPQVQKHSFTNKQLLSTIFHSPPANHLQQSNYQLHFSSTHLSKFQNTKQQNKNSNFNSQPNYIPNNESFHNQKHPYENQKHQDTHSKFDLYFHQPSHSQEFYIGLNPKQQHNKQNQLFIQESQNSQRDFLHYPHSQHHLKQMYSPHLELSSSQPELPPLRPSPRLLPPPKSQNPSIQSKQKEFKTHPQLLNSQKLLNSHPQRITHLQQTHLQHITQPLQKTHLQHITNPQQQTHLQRSPHPQQYQHKTSQYILPQKLPTRDQKMFLTPEPPQHRFLPDRNAYLS